MEKEIFLLKPVLKDILWGGHKLKTKYHKGDMPRIAESWELSTHPEGVSFVTRGEYAIEKLSDYIAANPDVLGTCCDGHLPLLVKYIDAAEPLSVQVHPDDAYARENGEECGKTEFWYVMDCEPGATLYYGLRRNVSGNELVRLARDGSIIGVLREVSVKPGDTFLLKPGTVHAIGANMTVAEIGTNCNITYRLHDYGRKDDDGNTRPLHLEQAAEVFRNDNENPGWDADGKIDCGPFTVARVRVDGIESLFADDTSFHCVMCARGSCEIDGMLLRAGHCMLVPAGHGCYVPEGNALLLVVTANPVNQ